MQVDSKGFNHYPQPLSAPSDISECIQSSWVHPQWPSSSYITSTIFHSPRNFPSSPFLDESGCFLYESSDEPSWSSFSALDHVGGRREVDRSLPPDPQISPTTRNLSDREASERHSSVAITSINGSQPVQIGEEDDGYRTKKRKSVSVPSRQYKPARTRSNQRGRIIADQKGRRKSAQSVTEEGRYGRGEVFEADDPHRYPRSTENLPLPKRALSDSGPPKIRHNHNITEKRYRARLNDQFDTLLSALPAASVAAIDGSYDGKEPPGRKISKAEVLILAKEHIQALETSRDDLEEKNRRLSADREQLEIAWGRLVGRMIP